MRILAYILSALLVAGVLIMTDQLYVDQPPDEKSAAQQAADNSGYPASEVGQLEMPEGLFDANGLGTVYARINDIDVHKLELWPYLTELMPAARVQQLKTFDEIPQPLLTQAMQSLAIDALLEQRAISQDMQQNPGAQAAIRQYARRYLRAMYLSSIAPTLVTEEQTHDAYDKFADEVKTRQDYHARHILLASEKEARVVLDDLKKKKKTFAELAAMFSLDVASKFSGGDLGYHSEGQLNPQFEAAISNLPLQQYSKPFKTDLGWHIAVVDERQPGKPLPYEQAAPAIRDRLQQQALAQYVQEILSSAEINIVEASNHPGNAQTETPQIAAD